jgi:hypothetical protein
VTSTGSPDTLGLILFRKGRHDVSALTSCMADDLHLLRVRRRPAPRRIDSDETPCLSREEFPVLRTVGGVVGGSGDEPVWRSARRCDTGQCLEIGTVGDFVMVRNSADPDRACVTLSRDEWHAFISGVKNGEFDDI